MKTNLTLLLLVTLLIINEGYSQQISTPYDFPIKPGMDEWKKFQTQEDMIIACQVPEGILKKLTTEALAETCLKYPIYLQITTYNNVQNGFERFASQFNGFSELLARPDVGQVLLSMYTAMDPSSYANEWASVKKGRFIFDFLYIEMLLAQKEVLASLNATSKKTLAIECLKKYDTKLKEKDLFGLVGLGHTAFIMSNLLNSENDKGFQSTAETDEKVKVFRETALTADFETLTKIKDLTTEFSSRK